MTVNIRFCGGCNPRYDRRAFAERIRAEFPDFEYIFNAEENTDAVIILCGCPAACASVPKEYGPAGRLKVSGADMWEETAVFLKGLGGCANAQTE